jgi:hypothetical protein
MESLAGSGGLPSPLIWRNDEPSAFVQIASNSACE